MRVPCGKADCYEHEGQQCAWGASRSSCPHAKSQAAPEGAPSAQENDDGQGRVCWTGQALGLADLGYLTPRGRTVTVGVLGDHDAGKTTMLVAAYLMLLRGESLAGAQFAGSRTLGAWEALASWVRPSDAARGASFPPHTPIGAGRMPGLLHIALRSKDEQFRDLLFTDAPGEWFTKWAMNETSAGTEGARWVAEHANVLMVVLDSQRLADPVPRQRGAARSSAQLLIERLGNHHRGRPVLVVWAKADHQPPAGIRRQIQESIDQHLPGAKSVEATTEHPHTLAAAISQAIALGWDAPRAAPLLPPQSGEDAFLFYRGAYGC